MSWRSSGLWSGYSQEAKPLGSYALLTGVFAGGLTAALAAGRDRLPERVAISDLLLFGVASQRLSRLIAKDRVTSFARAPFTRYQGEGGPGEVEEEPRGSGLPHAIGQLLVCPYCLAQWVMGAFVGGLVLAPRVTRLVGALFAGKAIADLLQIAYKQAEDQL